MEFGAAGAMELPPTYAYVGQHGIESRYRATSAATGKNLIVYAKGDVGVIPSDAIIARLAGEGLICAVKRACDSAPFESTASAVATANPAVLKIQGAAERFVPGVVGIADGYTTGSGVVFPNISRQIEAAFLEHNLPEVRRLTALFAPVEQLRALHGTAYNIAPLKWLLKNLYQIANSQTRPRYMDLLPADEPALRKHADTLAAAETAAATSTKCRQLSRSALSWPGSAPSLPHRSIGCLDVTGESRCIHERRVLQSLAQRGAIISPSLFIPGKGHGN
jgi:dihydrodipicolinate synthase/N-acetylneuraminate lyase